MSDIEMIRSALSASAEESGMIMAGLLEIGRRLEELQAQIGMAASGSTNETVQQALATFGLAATTVHEQVAMIGTAGEQLMEYYHQL